LRPRFVDNSALFDAERLWSVGCFVDDAAVVSELDVSGGYSM